MKFVSRNRKEEFELKVPVKDNKASEVVFGVLKSGKLPEGCELRYAKSYGGHYIAKGGKNALGASDQKDLLVVNGIAEELKATPLAKELYNPLKGKKFVAISLKEKKPEEIKKLITLIARVLGFVPSAKKVKAKKITGKKEISAVTT